MPFTLIEVVAVIFALFALSRVILRLKDGNLTRREFVFWMLVWIILGVIVFVPNTVTAVAHWFGIQQGMNLVVTISIMLLFYMLFRLYVKVENTEQEITKLVRQISLEKKKRK
jgi:small membrane protein